MIEAAIISILDSGTFTYVDSDKVYTNRVPQNAEPPYAYIIRTSTRTNNSKGNTSHIDEAIIRINIVSGLLQTCENWAEEIRGEIDGVINQSAGGSSLHHARFIEKDYIFLDDVDAHLMSLEFSIKENL